MHFQKSARKLAYLVSQYPKVSHSFIRREILALEQEGWQIFRLSIRGWDLALAEDEDISERTKTTFVLRSGALALAMAMARQVVCAPRRFFAAASLAVRMMRLSDRPFVWHFFYLAEACWIVPQLTKRNITHMHAHFGVNDAEVAMLANELSGISYSFTVHGWEEFGAHLAEKVRRATFVVTVCSFGRSQIFRVSDQQCWNKIKVVHCGIDPTFADLEAVEPSDTNKLVCVGRLCAQKGQLLLVKSISVLIKEGRNLELVFVGDGEDRAILEQLIAENDLKSFVKITGWANARRVRDEIISARALILPSFSEGLPTVIVEAMVLGRPVLSTYIAGIPELVINGKTGWLFPAGSEKDMSAAIRSCLDTSEEALLAMGVLARARALQRHDLAFQVKRLTTLFEAALQGSQKQSCSTSSKQTVIDKSGTLCDKAGRSERTTAILN
jgi:colanic acid/amylovoran biosynthesis glycosyltransferase